MMGAILRTQRSTNDRAMVALRVMLARNEEAQAAVARMGTRPEAAAFERALEALIVRAWKGKDVTEQREAVKRIYLEARNVG